MSSLGTSCEHRYSKPSKLFEKKRKQRGNKEETKRKRVQCKWRLGAWCKHWHVCLGPGCAVETFMLQLLSLLALQRGVGCGVSGVGFGD